MAPVYRLHIRSEVAPCVTTGPHNDPLQSQRQHTQRHMGMKHAPAQCCNEYAQPAFERALRLLDAWPLLVPQRQIGRAQAVVVALHHACAVEGGFRTAFRRVHPEQPALGHAQRATIATARPQVAHVCEGSPPEPSERGQLGREFTQDLRAMGALARCLVRIVADAGATTALSLTPDHFFAPQVVCHLLLAARALEDLGGHVITAAHRHAPEGCTPALAELFAGVL